MELIKFWQAEKLFQFQLPILTNLEISVMSATPFVQDKAEFDSLLAEATLLVVDCTASWCGPCKVVAPLIDKLSEEYSDRAKIFKLDLDNNKEIAKEYGIRSIPAVMYFQKGELMETLVGVKPYEEFTKTIEKFL